MLPVVAGETATRRQILLYTLVLAPLGLAPWLLGYAGLLYGATAVVTGGVMLALAVRIHAASSRAAMEQACRQLFAFSILYLFLLFAVLLVEQGIGGRLAA
jgi:protoheme IX farnesyltransferase